MSSQSAALSSATQHAIPSASHAMQHEVPSAYTAVCEIQREADLIFLELQDASIYCITQLARSLSSKNKKCIETSNRESLMNFLDNIPSPYSQSDKDMLCAGDSTREDCQPEYIVEECCKILINIYLKSSDNNLARSSQGLFYLLDL